MEFETSDCLNIVCISPAPWDYPIWTNRQHVMARMAKTHRVLYVFHPPFLRSSIKRTVFLNRYPFVSQSTHINENLTVFTSFVLPFGHRYAEIHRLNVRVGSRFLRSILRSLGFEKYLLWFYDPEAVHYLDYLSPVMACYDCVDEFTAMPSYEGAKRRMRLKRLELQLIERCDIVFATSRKIYEMKRQVNPNTFLVENVGDYEHFSKARLPSMQAPADFPKVQQPIIGFVGALDHYKVDFALIDYLATNRPRWSIVLIGARLNKAEEHIPLPDRDNIFYLGLKEYSELPNYISQFSACIIPYKMNEYVENVFPIKFFEFLATGKPVITTALPSLKKYSEVVRIAETYDDFVLGVEIAIADDSDDLREKRISLARNNTWQSRVDKLLSHVDDILRTR